MTRDTPRLLGAYVLLLLGLIGMAWLLGILLVGCVVAPVPPLTPVGWPLRGPAPAAFTGAVTVRGPDGTAPSSMVGHFISDDPAFPGPYPCGPSGGRLACAFPAGIPLGIGGALHIDAPGLLAFDGRANSAPEMCPCDPGQVGEVHLVAALPPPPTRQQLLTMQTAMYGLWCDVPSLGGYIPWWDPGIQALTDPAERASVYACKHARGDTGIIIGPGLSASILYDEPGNPYQVAIPTFDLAQRVIEHARAGLWTTLYLDGDGSAYQRAFDEFPIVYHALLHGGPNGEDLNRYVSYMPGWDGVFYSCDGCWDNDRIQAWARMARQTCAYCVLTLEFSTGHIPLGEGGGDFLPGGRMQDFDGVKVEFDFDLHNDNTWQILARLLGPSYVKPADDTNGPAPAYLTAPTVRGPWGVECFEPPTYLFVRNQVTQAHTTADRAYLAAVGCPVVD